MLLSKTQLKAFCDILKVGSKKSNNFMNLEYPQYVAISENNLKYTNGHFAIEIYNNRHNFEDEELTIVKTSEFLDFCKLKKYEVSTREILGFLPKVCDYKFPNIGKLTKHCELKPVDKFMLFNPEYYKCLMDYFIKGILEYDPHVENLKYNGQGMLVVEGDAMYYKSLTCRFLLMSLRD